jgi:hypothetical protein
MKRKHWAAVVLLAVMLVVGVLPVEASPTPSLTDRSLVLDAQGDPHVIYVYRGLQHAWRDETGWHTETVDPHGSSCATAAMDSHGYVHAAYVGDDAVWYVRQHAWGWGVAEQVRDGASYPCPSLALDGDDYPRVAYARGGDVWYAYWDGDNWQSEVAVSRLEGGYDWPVAAQLAMSDTVPFIGYVSVSCPKLCSTGICYASRGAEGWYPGDWCDGHLGVGSNSYAFALDARGGPHAAYAADRWDCYEWSWPPGYCLKGWWWDELTYVDYGGEDARAVERYDERMEVLRGPSLVVDADDYVHLAYRDGQVGGVVYARKTSGSTSWSHETVEASGAGQPHATSLVMDGKGNLHVAYDQPCHVRYAYRDPEGWHAEDAVTLPARLSIGPLALSFVTLEDDTATLYQTLAVRNSGCSTLTWSAEANQGWISMDPAGGTAPSDVIVAVDPTGFGTGDYTATLTVTAPGSGNSPQAVPVRLRIREPQLIYLPLVLRGCP